MPFDLLESLGGYHHSSFGYLSPHSFLSFAISFAITPQPITAQFSSPFPCVKLLSERLKYLITFFDISRAISVQQVTEIVYLQSSSLPLSVSEMFARRSSLSTICISGVCSLSPAINGLCSARLRLWES